MSRVRKVIHQLVSIVVAIVLIFAAQISGFVPLKRVDAAWLERRSLYVREPYASMNTTHRISFSYPGGTVTGSLVFEYCLDSLVDVPCVAPPGLDVSNAVLSNQTGIANYTILSATTNKVTLTRPAASIGYTPSSYTLDNVVNPSTVMEAYFIRMWTYGSTNGTGPVQDSGSVASSIPNLIGVTTEVPPLLYFCVGLEIVGECEEINGHFIQLGQLSSEETKFGESEMMVATNAEGGYVITVNGGTMTSGLKTIKRLEEPTANKPGTAQFGLNLADNTDPDIGADPVGAITGDRDPFYNQPDLYLFNPGDTVASAPGTSIFKKYTSSYIVNIPPDQPAGVYNTTITYLCTGTF